MMGFQARGRKRSEKEKGGRKFDMNMVAEKDAKKTIDKRRVANKNVFLIEDPKTSKRTTKGNGH